MAMGQRVFDATIDLYVEHNSLWLHFRWCTIFDVELYPVGPIWQTLENWRLDELKELKDHIRKEKMHTQGDMYGAGIECCVTLNVTVRWNNRCWNDYGNGNGADTVAASLLSIYWWQWLVCDKASLFVCPCSNDFAFLMWIDWIRLGMVKWNKETMFMGPHKR